MIWRANILLLLAIGAIMAVDSNLLAYPLIQLWESVYLNNNGRIVYNLTSTLKFL